MRWMRAAPLVDLLLNKQLHITTVTPSKYPARFSKPRHLAQNVTAFYCFFSHVYGYEENLFQITTVILSLFIITTGTYYQTETILKQYMQNSMALSDNTGI